MDVLQIIVFGLATWRVSFLAVEEKGPFKLFYKVRVKAGIVYSQNGTIIQLPDKFIPQLLSCVWCFSLYTGPAWTTFFLLSPVIAFYVALPFALSTCAILINLVVEKLKS